MTLAASTPKISAFSKALLALQVFLLRKKWLGRMGEQIMVITTQGRISGKFYSVPIGFLRDGESPRKAETLRKGETLIALTNATQPSNWYRNLLATPRAVLEIQGERIYAEAVPVNNPVEIDRIFNLYRKERKENFHRYFGIPADSSDQALKIGMDSKRFIRFYPNPDHKEL